MIATTALSSNGQKMMKPLFIGLSLLRYTSIAFFLRPDTESKKRRLWNLYHEWFGIVALFLGAVNIVLGLHYTNAGKVWQIGYGFVLGIVLLTCIVLKLR